MGQIILVDKDHQVWDDATIIAEPVKPKELTEPRVLVRRNIPDLAGPNNEELFCLPGEPTISLFTGCGGMDIGTEEAGFCTVVQNEWEINACKTLIVNRPNYFRHAALIQSDIRTTPTSMLLKEGGLRVGEATLVTGGPPCQGFSTAGKRRRFDERNDLVYQFLRVVKEAQPKHFVMENVPGFLSLNKGEYFEGFLRYGYECYYELVYGLVNAVEHGVPQDRCRFFCMGTRRDLWECEGKLAGLPKPETFSPKDIPYIQMLESGPLFQHEAHLFTHPPGIRYFPNRPILRPPRPTGPHKDGSRRSRSFIEFYRKLEKEEPDRIVLGPEESE